MNLVNETRKQHFVSQTEQRLNAYAGEKIYEFLIVRNGAQTTLAEPRSRAIASNLKLIDLFTFDVDREANLRENFEKLFHQYEQSLATLTTSVLEKARMRSADVANDLEKLFAAKLMSFARNPFSIEKMLNTFVPVKGKEPVDPVLKQLFDKVLLGRKPQQEYLCKELGVSDTMYQEWLAVLFMLLSEFQQAKPNFLNQAVQGLFRSTDRAVGAMICTYSTERALLSDRAMSSSEETDCSHFDFNLCSTAFVRYMFMDKSAALKGKASPEVLQRYLELDKLQRPQLFIRYEHDDLDALRAYNSNVIEQSYKYVYSSSKTVLV